MKNQVLTFPNASSIEHELKENERLQRVDEQCRVINAIICDFIEEALKERKFEIQVDVSISRHLGGFAIEPEVSQKLKSALWDIYKMDNDTYRLTVKE